MDEKKFVYPSWVDFTETVTMPDGSQLPRYGRRRQRAFRSLGHKAPYELDGSLFDRCNLLLTIMPINVRRVPGDVTVTPMGRVEVGKSRVVVSHLPGAGVYGDVGSSFGRS